MLTIEPVDVWETISARRRMTTVEQIATQLTERWPAAHREGDAYGRALRAALAALESRSPAAPAREAFVAAAREAGILAE